MTVGVAVQGAWGGEDNGVGQQGEGITGTDRHSGPVPVCRGWPNRRLRRRRDVRRGGAAGVPPPTLSGGLASRELGGRCERCPGLLDLCGELPRRRQLLGSPLIVAAGGGGFGGGGNSNRRRARDR